MGSPSQFKMSYDHNHYVKLFWEPTYWPSIYTNYPAQRFPTEAAARLFASGSITESPGRILKAEVYSPDDVLLDIYGGQDGDSA